MTAISAPEDSAEEQVSVAPDGCTVYPDPTAAVTHAAPHTVVSQVLRPDVGAFLPPETVKLRTLRDAHCCVTKVTLASVDPAVIEFAAQLPHLDTASVELTCDARDLGRLSRLTRLRSLSLSFCAGANAPFFAALPCFTELRKLSLFECQPVEARSLEHLVALPLEELDISCGDVEAEGLRHVAALSKLRVLRLSGGNVNAEGLRYLSAMPHLRMLDLSTSDGVGVGALAVVSTFNGLQSLRLWECYHVCDVGLQHLSTLSSLERLDINDCENVTAKGLAHLTKLERLRCLKINACDGATLQGLGHVSKIITLEKLNLADCSASEEALLLVSKLTRLTHLNVSSCHAVNERTLSQLSKLPRLRVLDVSSCDDVRASAIPHLARMPHLRKLLVIECHNLDMDDLRRSLTKKPVVVD